jgi:transglutaminase-like putative cysteine protease
MLFDIRLSISYDYASPAAGGRHLVRVMPADRPGQQRLVAGHLDIRPTPAERHDRLDFFGNLTTEFAFRAPHDRIELKLQARVQRSPAPTTGPASALGDLAAQVAAVHDLSPAAPHHFLAPSPRVPPDAGIAAFAARATLGSATVLEAVEALGRAIHRDMTYDPDATEVDTPAAEAFAARHGVCQDFSHIMISGLRSLGVPAGYVSGFLRTIPPPGKPRLEGADAMHAWVRAWCGPEMGWVDYDPTNALRPGTDHVTVAEGRDYFDVAPVKGVLRVSGRQTSKQAVDVLRLDLPA